LATFNFRSAATKKSFNASGFLGVDFTNSPENINIKRSPNAVNMIRDTPGKNKKRNGYKKEHTFSGQLNGIHFYRSDKGNKLIIHVGKELYLKEGDTYTCIYTNMTDARSSSAILAGKLVIIDGVSMVYYDGEKATDMKLDPYTPTVVVGRRPTGGGMLYEPINMISGKRIEKFTPDGVSKRFYLSAGTVDTVVYVQRRNTSGEWEEVSRNDYSTSDFAGSVSFATAPEAPTDGQDSILICYYKQNMEYERIITSSTLCTLYGINGAMDRIFLAGNYKYPNRDYYCQMEDPSYWGDTWYSTIGKSDSPIVGYSIVSDCLATHKAGEDSNANIILRQGTIMDNEPCFPVVGTYPSGGAVSSYSFGILDNEPVYLSEDGISAITPSDVLGERFSQIRSYFLNGKLLSEENMTGASAVSYKGFYMLLLNEKMYILDGLQSAVSNSEPFSHRQYEAYFWDNIPGKFLFTDGQTLYMAGKNGELYSFSESEKTDDGTEFEASWEFAEFFGDDFSRLKTITHIDVLIESGAENTILEYCDENGNWIAVSEQGKCFSDKILSKKIHIKDCASARFRIRNLLDGDFKMNKIKISFISGRKIS